VKARGSDDSAFGAKVAFAGFFVLESRQETVHRIFKQLTYGFFFLSILGLILLIFISPRIFQASCFDGKRNQGEQGIDCGGPCPDCSSNFQPLEIGSVEFFPAEGNRTNFAVSIQNPDSDYGLKLDYELRAYNRFGFRFFSFLDRAELGPGEQKYIFIPAAADFRDVRRADLEIEDGERWPAAEFSYTVRIEDVATAALADRVRTTGRIVNQSVEEIGIIELGAFVFDQNDRLINFSSGLISNLAPFSEREFFLEIPNQFLNRPVRAEKTRIFFEIR